MSPIAAKAVFLAGLPTGKDGKPLPGHTTWDQLGPKAQERYRRMAEAAFDSYEPPAVCVGDSAIAGVLRQAQLWEASHAQRR